MADLVYRIAGITLHRFHASNARRRGITGPVRSGKSTACCFEGMRRSHEQEPWMGARKSRGAIIRNTYGDLERTTLATWKALFGQRYGIPVGRKAGIVHEIRDPLEDGTLLECDVTFLALDHPDDVSKLLSLELTWAYVNEAKDTHRAIIETLDDRVGQFPAKKDGGVTWSGWWFDTNPPDDANWVYELSEEIHPEGWDFFRQPGGIIQDELGRWIPNPRAENLQNLNDEDGQNYYISRLPGKTVQHIRVMYAGQYGFLVDGQRVFHEFDDELHTSKTPLELIKGLPIYIGVDGGKTPAAAVLQRLPNRRWHLVRELVAEKIGVNAFVVNMFKPMMQDLHQQGFGLDEDDSPPIIVTGDPAMAGDVESDFNVYESHGIHIQAAFTNDWGIRRDVLGLACSELVDGKPRFLLSKSCPKARLSLAKGYVLRKIGTDSHGVASYELKPDKKSVHSHIGDCVPYGMMGSGEGRQLMSGGRGQSGKLPGRKLGTRA